MKTPRLVTASISLFGLLLTYSIWPLAQVPPDNSPHLPTISAPADSPTVQVPDPATEFPALSWVEGDRATWKIATTIRFLESSAADATTGETKLTAHMHAVVLDASLAEVTLAVALTVPEYSQEQSRVPAIEQLLGDTPAILSLKPDGTMKSVRFPVSIPDEDRQVLMLAYGWEFVVRPTETYETIESFAGDENASFQAAYRREPDGVLVKTRTTAPSNLDASSRQEMTSSRFTGKLGHLWLASLAGSEQTRVFIGDSMLVAPTVSVSLNEVESEPLPKSLQRLSSAASEQRILILNDVEPRKSVTAELKADSLRKKWAAIPLSQAIAPLRKVAGKPMAEVVGPMHDLRDWLSVHPELLDSVLTTTRGIDDAEISAMIIQAMTTGESDTANAALTSVMRDAAKYTAATVIQAAASAGQLGAKASESLITALGERYSESLENGHFELADASVLSLARIARNNPVVRESIDKTFVPDLAPGVDPEDSAMALMILENAQIARPEIISRASEFVKAGAQEAQTAAISYLSSLPAAPEIDRGLIAALKQPNPLVQTAARAALSREGRFRSALVQQALNSASNQPRKE